MQLGASHKSNPICVLFTPQKPRKLLATPLLITNLNLVGGNQEGLGDLEEALSSLPFLGALVLNLKSQ